MQVPLVLGLSVVLQLTAVALAFRLIRFSERRFAWGLIASAIILMATRRSITLYRLVLQDVSKQPDLPAELVALVISILMVVGLGFLQRAARARAAEYDFADTVSAYERYYRNLVVGRAALQA